MMVTSDFRDMAVSRMSNEKMQYNLYLWTNRQISHILREIVVTEVYGDVRFQSGYRNMAISR